MPRSLSRYLRRHRARFVRELELCLVPVFGATLARREALSFVEGLERSLGETGPGQFLVFVAGRIEEWARRGASEPAIVDLLHALLRGRPRVGRNGERRDWAAALLPILDFVPSSMLFVDPENTIQQANRAFCRLTGEQPEQLIGRRLDHVFTNERGEPPRFPAASSSGGSLMLARLRLLRAPAIELIGSRVAFNPGGGFAGWFLMLSSNALEAFADRSLPERLEHERRQKERFATLLAVNRAVASTLDMDDLLKTIARQARSVVEVDECTVYLHHPEDDTLRPAVCEAESYVEEVMALVTRPGSGLTGSVFQTGTAEIVDDVDADPRTVHVPGTPFDHSSMLLVPLESRDSRLGVITLTRLSGQRFLPEDLEFASLLAGPLSSAIENARLYAESRAAYDELRRTQQQLVQSAKLNALGEMAGGVAHDFNNVLAAILGRAQLLLQGVTDQEMRDDLAVIEQAALDGAHTVRRVQEFTRVRADEHFETLDINQVLLGVVELTRAAWEAGAKRRGIDIDVHLDLGATLPTPGSAPELREVFTNLMLNAVDALPAGGHVAIRTENGRGVVRVMFEDDGIGMNADTRSRVFDPFFTTKSVKGMGLGLSVAYGIVSRHRGTIEVESEETRGTTFTLTLPVGEVVREAVPEMPSGPVPERRVLVVDDEQAVLDVLADLLRMQGQHVVTALGGPAGAEALRQGAFDILFTDLGMPDVNGWDLAQAAHTHQQGCRVVLVTGWGFQLEEEAVNARGIDLIMAKPFSWDDLDRVLRQLSDAPGSTHAA